MRFLDLRSEFQTQSLSSRRCITLDQFSYKILNNFCKDSYLLYLMKIKAPNRYNYSCVCVSLASRFIYISCTVPRNVSSAE